MIIGNVDFGHVFRYDGALFVMLHFDFSIEKYPSMCIATRNSNYTVGDEYTLDEQIEIDELITPQRLKSDFIPKDTDYEME